VPHTVARPAFFTGSGCNTEVTGARVREAAAIGQYSRIFVGRCDEPRRSRARSTPVPPMAFDFGLFGAVDESP